MDGFPGVILSACLEIFRMYLGICATQNGKSGDVLDFWCLAVALKLGFSLFLVTSHSVAFFFSKSWFPSSSSINPNSNKADDYSSSLFRMISISAAAFPISKTPHSRSLSCPQYRPPVGRFSSFYPMGVLGRVGSIRERYIRMCGVMAWLKSFGFKSGFGEELGLNFLSQGKLPR